MQYDQTFMIKEKLNTVNSQYKNNGQNKANAHIHTIYIDTIDMSPFKWPGNIRLLSDSSLENLKEKSNLDRCFEGGEKWNEGKRMVFDDLCTLRSKRYMTVSSRIDEGHTWDKVRWILS